MNERIQELAKQAGGHKCLCVDAMSISLLGENSIEKFAELIVRECISINRQRMFSDYEGDSLRVAHNNALLCATSDMFEHFGVEE